MPTKKFSMNSQKGPNFVIAKRAPSGHCARCGNLDFYHGLLGHFKTGHARYLEEPRKRFNNLASACRSPRGYLGCTSPGPIQRDG